MTVSALEESHLCLRTRVLSVAIVLALLLSGLALLAGANRASGSSAGVTPAVLPPFREMKFGWVDYNVGTLNPIQITLTDEYAIMYTVYSTLITLDEDYNYVPDLAMKWGPSATVQNAWEVWLAPNAHFIDPYTCQRDANGHTTTCDLSHPVTGYDVQFTYMMIAGNLTKAGSFGDYVREVKRVDVDPLNPLHVTIVFKKVYVPALDTFSTIMILPKYVWQPNGITYSNPLPIGSGSLMVRPWQCSNGYLEPDGKKYCMTPAPPVYLDRNPFWHGMEVLGLQVFTDTLRVESYANSAVMSQDLTLGVIDVALSPEPTEWMYYLAGKPGITRQSIAHSFVAEMAVNMMTPYLRTLNPSRFNAGTNNQVLQNQVVRAAIHMATNRQKMIDTALLGLGEPADTVVPAIGIGHYDMPDYVAPFVATSEGAANGYYNNASLGPITPNTEFPDDTMNANPSLNSAHMARQLLHDAGWLYSCASGAPDDWSIAAAPLCRDDGAGHMVDKLEFRFATLSSENWWKTASESAVEDALKAGIKFNLVLYSVNQMNNQIWWKMDYDVWLWDWVFTPSADPATGVLSVQTCENLINATVNDNGWCMIDPVTGRWTYDDMYNASLSELNPVKRQNLINEMQRLIYQVASYNLPFYRDEVYAMSDVRWTNWGDWNAHPALLFDMQNLPLITYRAYPVNQKPPQVPDLPPYQGVRTHAVQFTVAAVDPEGTFPLSYRWDFDDKVDSNLDGIPWNDADSTLQSPTHTYNVAGTYNVTLRVSENGGEWFTQKKTAVTILDPTSQPVQVKGMAYGPTDPATTDPAVTFIASAVDPTGGTLTYSWNFGDGGTGTGNPVSHTYASAGTRTVSVRAQGASSYADSSTIVNVIANTAPSLASLPAQTIQADRHTNIANLSAAAFASDLNLRDTLTYSWAFGDAGTASGNPVTHGYECPNPSQACTFTLSVTVQDTPGSHTASSSTTITVVPAGQDTAPTIVAWTASPTTTYPNQLVTFHATVYDSEGDAINWSFDMRTGDGIIDYYLNTTKGIPYTWYNETVTHQYPAAGSYIAKLVVTDGVKSSSKTVTITVLTNVVPTLTPLTVTPGNLIPFETATFSSVAHDTGIPPDALTYTWDFGDGAPVVTGTTPAGGATLTQSHTYTIVGDYVAVLTVNDGKGGVATQTYIMHVTVGGLLRVSTSIDLHPTWGVWSQVLVDGIPRDEWGLAWMKIEPGSHTISWTASPALGTPAPQTVTVTDGLTTVVNGEFKARGFLRVTQGASPVAGTVYVNDVPMDDWGIWLALDPGVYKVSWGAVAGFNPPATEFATVTAEALTTVIGNYVPNAAAPGPDPATFGLLRVTTSIDLHPTWGVWSQVLVDGIPRDEWGLAWLKIAPGSHTISWTDSPGLTTPAPQTVTVVATQTTNVNGEFKARGFLRVTQEGMVVPGTVFVNGIPRNDWGMWMALPPGTYTVTWGAVPDCTAPGPSPAVVVAETSVTVVGSYVYVGGLAAPSSGSNAPSAPQAPSDAAPSTFAAPSLAPSTVTSGPSSGPVATASVRREES